MTGPGRGRGRPATLLLSVLVLGGAVVSPVRAAPAPVDRSQPGPGAGIALPAAEGPRATGAALASPAAPAACPTTRFAIRLADEILAGRLRLGPHPEVRLARDPSWAEHPVADVNWDVRYQGLSWLGPLVEAWRLTGEGRYARRVRSLVDDWLTDNPPGHARSGWAWYNQAAGIRASMLSCIAGAMGAWPRLRAGLLTHGRVLADPGFYVWQGNHALDQAIGLLDAGHAVRRADWMRLARGRIADLVVRSVSALGVTNEQAVGYQTYNLRHYVRARDRMTAYGITPPAGMVRIERMPWFLAFAILPDGRYDLIGDTSFGPVGDLAGTIAERSATAGTSGRLPGATVAAFPREGWLFARTGWGLERPFRDEVALSLRFGRPPIFHGHADGGAVTLYGFGSRLVLDPGKYEYQPSPLRTWFKSRRAHNVVLVDGVRLDGASTQLLRRSSTPRLVAATLRTASGGTSVRRTVLFSRRLGYVVVQDVVATPVGRAVRQRWHLREDARPLVGRDGAVTRRPRGNVRIIDLTGSAATRVVPGWVSYHYGQRLRAPIVELVERGRQVRLLTLLVPGGRTAAAAVTDLRLSPDGATFTITVDGRSERVTLDGLDASIGDA